MQSFDLGIVGAGPGGYVAAIRAAQLGMKVVIFERERVGGVCLNWGCIPSKALLHNADLVNTVRDGERYGIKSRGLSFDYGPAYQRSREVVDKFVGGVEGLFQQHKISLVSAEARLKDAHTLVAGGDEYSAGHVIVATGSSPRVIPGLEPDGEVVLTSKESILRASVPKSAVIVGGGPIGCEAAYTWNAYGAEVTVVEILDNLLPLEDPDLSRVLRKSFEGRGIRVLTASKVTNVEKGKRSAKVSVDGKDGAQVLEAEVVLAAVGITPNLPGIGLEELGVQTDRGFVVIDDSMRTSVDGVLAIGDVTGKLPLAHVASAQGVLAVERLAGHETPDLNYDHMPRATYCQPQVASVGISDREAKERGIAVKSGRFPFRANGKAMALGEDDGFVKVVAGTEYGEIVGIQMVGPDVSELLGEAALAQTLEASAGELGFAVHAHPTLSEALKEAALAVRGEAIHVYQGRISG
jgi:dihydrolipoamide dehydrogenase